MVSDFIFHVCDNKAYLRDVKTPNRSQKTPKCGKNISDILGYVPFIFVLLPHFDAFRD